MKNYIIYAPKYGKSNGIRVLYKLAELLTKKGYSTYMYAIPDASCSCKYIEHITDKMREEDIVIYPEAVSGNPLQFQNVVRWILYFPGVLGGDDKYDDYEILFTFAKEYYQNCDILSIPTIDENLFYKDNTKKDINTYFVYKGGKWRDVPEFKGMIEINANYPEKREDLANLLRRTKIFYSFDNHTSLLDEAAKCGCRTKIVVKNGFEDYISRYDEEYKYYEKQLDNFIQITQKLQYTGKIAPLSKKYLYKIAKFKLEYFLNKYIFFNKEKEFDYFYKSKGMM